MGLDLVIIPVTGVLHVGDTITLGESRVQWRVVAQSPKAWDLEAQMQRADEP